MTSLNPSFYFTPATGSISWADEVEMECEPEVEVKEVCLGESSISPCRFDWADDCIEGAEEAQQNHCARASEGLLGAEELGGGDHLAQGAEMWVEERSRWIPGLETIWEEDGKQLSPQHFKARELTLIRG